MDFNIKYLSLYHNKFIDCLFHYFSEEGYKIYPFYSKVKNIEIILNSNNFNKSTFELDMLYNSEINHYLSQSEYTTLHKLRKFDPKYSFSYIQKLAYLGEIRVQSENNLFNYSTKIKLSDIINIHEDITFKERFAKSEKQLDLEIEKQLQDNEENYVNKLENALDRVFLNENSYNNSLGNVKLLPLFKELFLLNLYETSMNNPCRFDLDNSIKIINYFLRLLDKYDVPYILEYFGTHLHIYMEIEDNHTITHLFAFEYNFYRQNKTLAEDMKYTQENLLDNLKLSNIKKIDDTQFYFRKIPLMDYYEEDIMLDFSHDLHRIWYLDEVFTEDKMEITLRKLLLNKIKGFEINQLYDLD